MRLADTVLAVGFTTFVFFALPRTVRPALLVSILASSSARPVRLGIQQPLVVGTDLGLDSVGHHVRRAADDRTTACRTLRSLCRGGAAWGRCPRRRGGIRCVRGGDRVHTRRPRRASHDPPVRRRRLYHARVRGFIPDDWSRGTRGDRVGLRHKRAADQRRSHLEHSRDSWALDGCFRHCSTGMARHQHARCRPGTRLRSILRSPRDRIRIVRWRRAVALTLTVSRPVGRPIHPARAV